MARVKIKSTQYLGARSKSTTCIYTDSVTIPLTNFKPEAIPPIRQHLAAPRQSMAKEMSFVLVTINGKIVFLMVLLYQILTIVKCAFLSTTWLVTTTLRMSSNKPMIRARIHQYSRTGLITTRSKNHPFSYLFYFLGIFAASFWWVLNHLKFWIKERLIINAIPYWRLKPSLISKPVQRNRRMTENSPCNWSTQRQMLLLQNLSYRKKLLLLMRLILLK